MTGTDTYELYPSARFLTIIRKNGGNIIETKKLFRTTVSAQVLSRSNQVEVVGCNEQCGRERILLPNIYAAKGGTEAGRLLTALSLSAGANWISQLAGGGAVSSRPLPIARTAITKDINGISYDGSASETFVPRKALRHRWVFWINGEGFTLGQGEGILDAGISFALNGGGIVNVSGSYERPYLGFGTSGSYTVHHQHTVVDGYGRENTNVDSGTEGHSLLPKAGVTIRFNQQSEKVEIKIQASGPDGTALRNATLHFEIYEAATTDVLNPYRRGAALYRFTYGIQNGVGVNPSHQAPGQQGGSMRYSATFQKYVSNARGGAGSGLTHNSTFDFDKRAFSTSLGWLGPAKSRALMVCLKVEDNAGNISKEASAVMYRYAHQSIDNGLVSMGPERSYTSIHGNVVTVDTPSGMMIGFPDVLLKRKEGPNYTHFYPTALPGGDVIVRRQLKGQKNEIFYENQQIPCLNGGDLVGFVTNWVGGTWEWRLARHAQSVSATNKVLEANEWMPETRWIEEIEWKSGVFWLPKRHHMF